jgi:hypothetical protein
LTNERPKISTIRFTSSYTKEKNNFPKNSVRQLWEPGAIIFGFDYHRRIDTPLTTNATGLAQAQLFPLRKDNARLVRENNELHREAIGQAEASEQKLRGLDRESKKLASDLEEAKFLRAHAEAKLAAQVLH